MRWRIAIFVFLGMMTTVLTRGQAQRPTPPGGQIPNWHWPDDGAQNPSVGQTRWEGQDAVGLQLKDRDGNANYLVPVSALKISGRALKEMRKSDKALLAGDVKGSAEHLAKMLELMPDLAIGHNALGARYVVLGEYDKAIAEFETAVAQQPSYRLAVDNIVVAMCAQHRYVEAEQVARRALKMQPDAASSKYLLGSILISEGKPTDEASKLLRATQDKYPRAKLFLAETFVWEGKTERAAEELREYLRSPLANDNGVAQKWLAQLEKQVATEQSETARKQE